MTDLLFDFEFAEVMSHCNQIRGDGEQIDYLEYVLKEHQRWRRGQGFSGKPSPINTAVAKNNPALLRRTAKHELHRRFHKSVEEELRYRRNRLTRHSNRRDAGHISGENRQRQDANKILWLGSDRQLAYLIELLCQEGLLSRQVMHSRFSMIEQHFVDSQGKPFDNRKLSKNVSNSVNPPRDHGKLEQIVKSLKGHV